MPSSNGNLRRLDALVVARFAPAPATGPEPAGSLQPMFLRRTGRRHTRDGVDHVRDQESSDWYEISDRRVCAWYQSDAAYFLRDPARLVREYAVDELCRRGALRLHAAAARVGGAGVLIVGAAGSGKSSTVAQLVAAGAGFVANDRALVVPGPRGPDIIGVPLAVRWSAPQLRWFRSGERYLEHYHRRSAYRASDEVAGFRKYELTPAEVAGLSGRPLVPTAPLRAVVVADRTEATEPATLSRVDRALVHDELMAHHLSEDPAFPRFFRQGPLPPPPSPAPLVELALRRRLALLRLRGRYDDVGAASLLFEAVGKTS